MNPGVQVALRAKAWPHPILDTHAHDLLVFEGAWLHIKLRAEQGLLQKFFYS